MTICHIESWVEKLTWPQIEKKIASGATAILPIGAGSKEHGRHLPLNTDFLQAQCLADKLAASENVLIWPVLGYGYYPAFVDYPGSISVDASLFANTVSEIINGIIFSGIEDVMILNTGISTIPPLQKLLALPKYRENIRLHNVYSGTNFTAAIKAVETQAYGGHADEIETSIMLAIDESLVNMSFAKAPETSLVKPIARGLFNRSHPEQANYSPDGVNGDPSTANKEKGEVLLKALHEDCLIKFREER